MEMELYNHRDVEMCLCLFMYLVLTECNIYRVRTDTSGLEGGYSLDKMSCSTKNSDFLRHVGSLSNKPQNRLCSACT
jgi:hypothetical protein